MAIPRIPSRSKVLANQLLQQVSDLGPRGALRTKPAEVNRALQMEAAGEPKEAIQYETKVSRGKEGDLRYETGDVGRFNPRGVLMSRAVPLGSIFPDAFESYNAYPDLQHLLVQAFDPKKMPDTLGYYNAPGGPRNTPEHIGVSAGQSDDELRKTLLHEGFGHAIQYREGLPRGGGALGGMSLPGTFGPPTHADSVFNQYYDALKSPQPMTKPQFLRDVNIWNDPKIADRYYDSYLRDFSNARSGVGDAMGLAFKNLEDQSYWRNSGEVQPRNYETRADFTEQQRRDIHPEVTEDVLRSKQIPRAPRPNPAIPSTMRMPKWSGGPLLRRAPIDDVLSRVFKAARRAF